MQVELPRMGGGTGDDEEEGDEDMDVDGEEAGPSSAQAGSSKKGRAGEQLEWRGGLGGLTPGSLDGIS
jgi:hypothetical protein